MVQLLGSLHPHGDPEAAPGFEFEAAAAVVAIWGVKQHIDDLCLSSFCKLTFQIKIFKKKLKAELQRHTEIFHLMVYS